MKIIFQPLSMAFSLPSKKDRCSQAFLTNARCAISPLSVAKTTAAWMAEQSYHLAVSAGAGTGKTYALVENYVQALLGLDKSGIKKRPDQILALTFTQKAAQEMRVRIAKRLNGLLLRTMAKDDPLF